MMFGNCSPALVLAILSGVTPSLDTLVLYAISSQTQSVYLNSKVVEGE